MVRLYRYVDYRWDLVSNIVDDAYQVITDFYYGAKMNDQYGEIKGIIKDLDITLWKDAIPPDTKNVYLLITKTRTFTFIESLLSERKIKKYY